ncbi:hypothetical protein [Peribacillus kribbensis]|nr:hypothetical protein [Peribacillus kribbensis]
MKTKDNFPEGAKNTKDNQVFAPADEGQKHESPQSVRGGAGKQDS